MCSPGRPASLLLLCLLSSAASSPVSTPSPPLPSQISSPTVLLPSPPVGVTEEPQRNPHCPLTVTPSALVVRFGDPVTANCSLNQTGFPMLGWAVTMAAPDPTGAGFLVWRVERMTEWSLTPTCWALSEPGGQCQIELPLIVFKPPGKVSLGFLNHTGPMLEGRQYTLQCTVQDVAPVERLLVTFYRGRTAMGRLRSSNNRTKEPVTETFTLNVNASRGDDGESLWCEAKLELGPEGPRLPPVVQSEKIPVKVLFGPQLVCPLKLRVKEGEGVSCEVTGNPQPRVTWYRDGQVAVLPARSGREHAGSYTVRTEGGASGQRNFTVVVEVVPGSGSSNSFNRLFLLAVCLIQMVTLL